MHHAVCAVVCPIFEASFIANTFANRVGKGTHRAIHAYECYRDRHAHVLRCDIYRYFPAIDHEVLKQEFRRRIACEQTLCVLDLIVDGSNRQEAVNLYFEGDDLFSPFNRRRGLPIGNLTSQFFANLYLNRFDHWVTEVLRAPYVRYVDDFALFSDDPRVLEEWRMKIADYLVGRRLRLHPVKTRILSTKVEQRFLGFVLSPNGERRLPEDNVRRFRNRLRGLKDRSRMKSISLSERDARIASWIAHAEHADTWRLRHAIFRDGPYDPANNIPRSLDGPLSPCSARRFVEQQTTEPPIGKSEQEQQRQPQQQQRFSFREYAFRQNSDDQDRLGRALSIQGRP